MSSFGQSQRPQGRVSRSPYGSRQDLSVVVKAKDLAAYVFVACEKCPKKFRFTIADYQRIFASEALFTLYG